MNIEYSKQAVKTINGVDRPTKQRITSENDDTAMPDDLEAIDSARSEFARGETVSHNAINWD